MSKLTLDDILDLRAYEKQRDEFRAHMMELKAKRRVHVGPFITLAFENRDTVRYQIQEMARAERMLRDEQIREELDIYNPLIPEGNQLTATLFIELTSKDELMNWLPKLVGIERSVHLDVGSETSTAEPEESHDEQLTREAVTASVHYVRFGLTQMQSKNLGTETVTLRVQHPAYRAEATLSDETKLSLMDDLRSS